MTRSMKSCMVEGAVAAMIMMVPMGSAPARAHCDTLEGPVVLDARRALESGDLAPVLKWIAAAEEPNVRESFKNTLAVRKLGGEARDLAERYFFETVVRIHRAGEGAPYEGLKPASSIPPTIVAADKALVSGSVEALSGDIAASVASEVKRRFGKAMHLKARAEESPEAGRAFVAAYVEYVHFVEAVGGLLGGAAHEHEGAAHPHASSRQSRDAAPPSGRR